MRSNILPAILGLAIVGLGGTALYNASHSEPKPAPAGSDLSTTLRPSDVTGTPNSRAAKPGDTSSQPDMRQVDLTYYVIHETGNDLQLAPRKTAVLAPGTPGMWRQAHNALTAMKDFPDSAQDGFRNPLPAGTRFLGIHFDGGIATVNLSGNIREKFNGGAREEQMLIYAIVNTVGQVSGVKGVRFEVDGQPISELAGHLDLSEPLQPDHSIVERTR